MQTETKISSEEQHVIAFKLLNLHQSSIEEIVSKYNNFTSIQQEWNRTVRDMVVRQEEKLQLLYEHISKLELLVLNRSEGVKV